MTSNDFEYLEEIESKTMEMGRTNEAEVINVHALKIILAELDNKQNTTIEEEDSDGDMQLCEMMKFEHKEETEDDDDDLSDALYEYNSIMRLSADLQGRQNKMFAYHTESANNLKSNIVFLKEKQDGLPIVQKYRKLEVEKNGIDNDLERFESANKAEIEANDEGKRDIQSAIEGAILRLVVTTNEIQKDNYLHNSEDLTFPSSSLSLSRRSNNRLQRIPLKIEKLNLKMPEIKPMPRLMTTTYTERYIEVKTTVSPPENCRRNTEEEISYAVSSVKITEVRNGRQEYVDSNDGINESLNKIHAIPSTAATTFCKPRGINGRSILKQATQKKVFAIPPPAVIQGTEETESSNFVTTSKGNILPIPETKKITVLSNVIVKSADKGTAASFVEQTTDGVDTKKKNSAPEVIELSETQDELSFSPADVNDMAQHKKTQNDDEVKTRKEPILKASKKQTANGPENIINNEPNLEQSSSHITIDSSNENNQHNDTQLGTPPENTNSFLNVMTSPDNITMKRTTGAAQKNNNVDKYDFFNLEGEPSNTNDAGDDDFDFHAFMDSPNANKSGTETDDLDFFNFDSPAANNGDKKAAFSNMNDFFNM